MMMMIVLFQEAERLAEVQQGLSPFATAFMLASMGAVTLLTTWCFWRILSNKQHFDPDGTGPAHSPVAGEADPRVR